MRRTTTVTALLLGTSFLAPTGLANAAGETCRGEAATIVGTGGTVHGTDGRDVIVSGASWQVLAGAGDDVVCVTGGDVTSGNSLHIEAGPGNDVVDSTGTAISSNLDVYLSAILGEGADTFVGGGTLDRVVAGPASSPVDVPAEGERDIIDTGDGGDFVTSGGPGLSNDDAIRTGDGEDYVIWSGTMGTGGILDGGAGGGDVLGPRTAGQTFRIDLAAQTLSQDGALTASFSSFERTLVTQAGAGTLEVIGTEGNDIVEVYAAATVRANLDGGNDQLTLRETKPQSRIDLGSGTDEISVSSFGGSVDLDLADRSLAMDGSSVATLTGVEAASVSAEQATVIGNGEANVFFVVGCTATIDGRGGDDVVSHGNYDFDADRGYDCEQGRTTLRGGPGDDELRGGKRADRVYGGSGDDDITTGPATSGKNKAWGGPGNDRLDGGSAKDVLSGGAGKDRLRGDKKGDVLLGGAGKDRSLGGPGRDRCIAEVERTCER